MTGGLTASPSKTLASRAGALILLVLCFFNCPVYSQSAGEVNKTKPPVEVAANYFTNTILITQDNKPVRFFEDQLKGKTVMINFMFTTCTGVCPAMTANLTKVQALLGGRVGKDINMISITVDSPTDTPEALKSYATKFGVKSGWDFLTGKKADVELVLKKLGGYVEDKNDHNTILIVGNVATGEWLKMYALAKPSEIAEKVLKLAGPEKQTAH